MFVDPIIDSYLQEDTKMTLTGSGFGNDASLIYISMGLYVSFTGPSKITIDQVDTKLSYTMIPGVKNGPLRITVSGAVFEYPDVKIKPKITTVQSNLGIMTLYPSPNVQLRGEFFEASPTYNVQVHMDNMNLSTCYISTDGTSQREYRCIVPPGYGSFNFYLISDGVSSDPFVVWYNPPKLQSIGALYYNVQNDVGLYGVDFQNGTFDRSNVFIDDTPCNIISSLNQEIHCIPTSNTIIPKVFGGSMLVKIEVAGQFTNNTIEYTKQNLILPIYQQNGLFVITLCYPNYENVNFLVNNQDVKGYCNASESEYGPIIIYLHCNFPSSIKSGGGGNFTTLAYEVPFDVYLSPFVTEVTTASTFGIPTQGGQISITGKYFEQSLLNGTSNQLEVYYNGNVITPYVLVNNTFITFNVPPGTGNLNTLYVRAISNTTQVPFKISYGLPTISSYTLVNNIVKLTGSNYGSDISLISLNYGGNIIPVSDFQLTTAHTAITFELKGTLMDMSCKEFNVTVDGLTSIEQSIIVSPIISNVSLLSVNGGTFTLEGTALSQETIDQIDLNWLLTIGGFAIDIQDCSITNTIVICYYPAISVYNGDGVSTSIKLTIQNNTSEIIATYQQSVTISSVNQIGQSLTINGLNFINDGLSIILNIIDITSVCQLDSQIKIICGPVLPITVSSGQLVISVNTYLPATFNVALIPYIESISSNLINVLPAGDIVTISGRYFESTSLKVIIDSIIEITTFNLIDSTSLTVTIPYGIGLDHNVKLSNNNGISLPVVFSYYPPSVLEFTQILNTNQFEIKLNNYSIDINENLIYHNDQLIKTIVSQQTNSIQFNLDDSFTDGELYVFVGNQKSNVKPTFLQPIIDSISKKPYQEGSVITVIGKYFSNYNYKTQTVKDVKMTFSYILNANPTDTIQLTCSYIDSTRYQCNQPKGYGTAIMISNKVDNTFNSNSNTLPFSYQEPKVIKSTSLYYQIPGKINVTVESFDQSSLQVFVETIECKGAIAVSNTMIQCDYQASVPPNSNGNSLNITVISNSMIGKNEVFFYDIKTECPNQCSNHGSCNPTNGQCSCSSEWQSQDCSQTKQPLPPPPVIDDNGDTILNGGSEINFTISIAYLREIDFNGVPIKTLSMKEIQWIDKNKTSNINSYFRGIFKNDSTIVELDVTYYSNNTDIDFAGDIISISSNSIKYIITISNYNFSTVLSSLQVIYNSQTQGYYDNGCELIPSKSNSTSETTNESVTWFQLVSGGGSVMDAKFSRRMFVDSKVRMSSVSILPTSDILYKSIDSSSTNEQGEEEYSEYYNRLTSITTPYFESSIVLDPSFSSLLSPTDNDSDSCSENKWKIPVIATLCSVGGAAIIASTAGFMYKKYKYARFQNSFKTKLSKIK